jgi:hypothetical protein
MPRPPALERRISSVLASIAPLTAGQIVKAVWPTDRQVVYVTICRLRREGVLRRVSCSASQRHQHGTGGAYTLEVR